MTPHLPGVEETARQIVRGVLDQEPTLGRTRLVCVDGPAGSGKTTLADALVQVAGDADLVHMDDVYEGWSGLVAGMDRVARDVVSPLREGHPGRYRRWDWHRSSHAEEHLVPPVDLLVLEGVGSGNAAYADAITCLVWVQTPSDVRLDRGIARDGEGLRGHWLAWAEQEDAMFAEHRTRDRADVLVDGLSG